MVGRPYGGVAGRLSSFGLTRGRSRRGQIRLKLPRGAGYSKVSTLKLIRELHAFTGSVTQFARSRGLGVDLMMLAIQKYAPDIALTLARDKGMAPKTCPYCEREFYPMNTKQVTCSRRCQADWRVDRQYFGGRRREAIGIIERVCQLCEQPKTTLAVHHMVGKQNDPENKNLIALCHGCHQLVGHLAGRTFVEKPDALENLISLALIRRLGDKRKPDEDWGIRVSVEIEHDTPEEIAEMDVEDFDGPGAARTGKEEPL